MTDNQKQEELMAAIKHEQREEWHEPTYGRSYPMKKQKPLHPVRDSRSKWPPGWWVLPVALIGGVLWTFIVFAVTNWIFL